MEKFIDKLLKQLKIEQIAAVVLIALAYVLGYLGVIPDTLIEPKSQAEFVLNIIVVAATIGGIPLALKLFALNTTKGLCRMNHDEALQSFHNWSMLRLSMIVSAALLGIVVYFITLTPTGLYSSLAASAMVFYCKPSRTKIVEYLNQANS